MQHETAWRDYLDQRIRNLSRTNRRVAIAFGALAVSGGVWASGWLLLIGVRGTEAMRADDLMPPMGAFVLIPGFLAMAGAFLIANYRRLKRVESAAGDSLRDQARLALLLTRNRIRLLHASPVLAVGITVAGAVGLTLSPEFNPLAGLPPLLRIAAFFPDALFFAALVAWSRRAIRVKHQEHERALQNWMATSSLPA